MSFFLPSRLIEFEYFDGESDEDYEKEAKPYQSDIDFAFFAANFGYSKTDYEMLTQKEKIFIYKAWENRQAAMVMNIYNAVFTAFYNVNRRKNKPALKPLKKKSRHRTDIKTVKNNIKIVKQAEKEEGNEWIRTIYRANGLKPPERRKNG